MKLKFITYVGNVVLGISLLLLFLLNKDNKPLSNQELLQPPYDFVFHHFQLHSSALLYPKMTSGHCFRIPLLGVDLQVSSKDAVLYSRYFITNAETMTN